MDTDTLIYGLVGLAVLYFLWTNYFSSPPQAAQTQQKVTKKEPVVVKGYTKEEIAKHNKAEDAWIIVNKKVYDITPFVHEHIGGIDKILVNVGGDTTAEFFRSIGHSEKTSQTLDLYEIGYVEE